MHIAAVGLFNWECFRGEHLLELEAKPYGIFARHESDAERSNWMGKSSLARAIRFALTGEHEHRLEEGWVTRGEKTGYVKVFLSGGALVKRERKKSTVLSVSASGKGALGDEAQKLLGQLMGLTREDFDSSCFFAQGEMALHVTMKPEQRMTVVAGWVGLSKLEAAEEHNRTALREALVREGEARDKVTRIEDSIRACGEVSEAEIVRLEKHLKVQQESRKLALEQIELAKDQAIVDAAIDEMKSIDAELATIPAPNADLQGLLVKTRDYAHQQREQWQMSAREANQKRVLAEGKFDGMCPVAGIVCPAKETINAQRSENARLHQTAVLHETNTRSLHEQAENLLRSAEAKVQGQSREQGRAAMLERQRAKLVAVAEGYAPKAPRVDPVDARRRFDDACEQVIQTSSSIEVLASRLGTREELSRSLQAARARLAVAEATATPLREASAILGPMGAQRRAAEGSLADIELGANERLSRWGVDLSVGVRWDREGRSGMAKACATCGEPFPKSERVKACGRCGEERGPHIIQKLEYELSDRSGAADDIAGIAIRLAASEWLRRERGAEWAVALIDEPLGQLDASHRKAIGQKLPEMLREEFEQSFVIAHHAATLDSLPGRIEIVGGDNGSTVRVVA